jgi:7-cyano-7-deazaguanine synthase in queuosine biosynthesis
MTKVLILHSGGFDSAVALRHTLAQQTDVLAVHVNLTRPHPRFSRVMRYWAQEQWDWLEGQGFAFDTTVIESPDEVQGAPYYVTLLKEAATLFNSDPTLTHIMSGRCAEDATSPTRDWDDGWALFETMTGKTRDQVRMLSPYRNQTKAQAAVGLSEDFIELLWGCFRPFMLREDDPTDLEEATPCGACTNCEEYLAAGIWGTAYWIEPPIVFGPPPIPGMDWDALRPTQEVEEEP